MVFEMSSIEFQGFLYVCWQMGFDTSSAGYWFQGAAGHCPQGSHVLGYGALVFWVFFY